MVSMMTEQGGVGSGRGTNSTTAEATFGGGVKAAGGSVSSSRVRARHWEMTARRP